MDHSLSGVRMGGKGEEDREKEIHLTNVPEIDRKSPITCSTGKYACVCVFLGAICVTTSEKAQWES